MMSKMAVGETISRAYGFVFSNLLSIFGIAWLPYLILAAIAVGLVMLLAPELPGTLMRGQFDPFLAIHASRVFGLLGILSFIVTCMVTVEIQRKALGRHPEPIFVYFSLGAPVWRMAGALFLAWLVIVVITILTALAVVAIWFTAGTFLAAQAVWVRAAAIFVACLWEIYLIVRLTFFLPAVVVAEERVSLGRAWELAGGNFWRIFAIAVAVLVPVWIAFRIVDGALFGSMVALPSLHSVSDIHEWVRSLFRQIAVIGPFVIVARSVERIVFLGLANGMIAEGYQALVAPPPGPAAVAPPSA